MNKVLLLNASSPGEIRVAVLENSELAEIFIERKSQRQVTGNIYKARVANVEASLQAGFIDLGTPRNGFLHVSDCLPPGAKCLEDKPKAAAEPRIEPAAPAAAPQAAEGTVVAGGTAGEAVEGTPPQAAPAAVPAPEKKGRRRRRGGRGRSGRSRAPQQGAHMTVDPVDGTPTDHEIASEPSEPMETAPISDELETSHSADNGEELPPTDAREETSASTEQPATATDASAPAQPTTFLPVENGGSTPAVQPHPINGSAPPPDRRPRDHRDHRDHRGRPPERRYLVHDVLRKGQEVLVQVAKEGLGQKGPALTMYLSIPGRYLVLMPAISRLGVSKRIDDENQRRELKEILGGLKVPDGMGVIVRTAGMGRKREELQRDLDFLLNVWDTMKKKSYECKAPALIYEEGDVVTRVFRDVLTDDVSEIVIDDQTVLDRARTYLQAISPGTESRLKHYNGHEPLFHKYNVEPQIQRLFHRKVELKGGGSIVIEQTEALVAIDVNTGRYREKKNQDDTILMTNLAAAREIARQLRLRDIGGLIMIDFIDMDNLDHRRRVERELKMHLARDKARLNVMQISPLGIVEMTRQRVRQSLRKTFFEPCPCCGGTGHVKSLESVGLEVLREINDMLADRKGLRFRVSLNPETAFGIINASRSQWARLEGAHGAHIEADGDESLPVGQWKLWVANEKGDWVLKKSSEVDDYVRNN